MGLHTVSLHISQLIIYFYQITISQSSAGQPAAEEYHKSQMAGQESAGKADGRRNTSREGRFRAVATAATNSHI